MASARTIDRVPVATRISVPTLPRVRSSYAPPRALTTQEVRRRMLHMLPGLLPFVLWPIPHPNPWGPILANVFLAVTALIVGGALLRFSAFSRPGEPDGRSSVLGYAFPIIAALCLFRGREEIAMMTLAILAFGDGSATLGGMTFGGWRLPWNRSKTWTGLACFVLIGGPLASVVFWGESPLTMPWTVAAACGMTATLVAAIAESVPSRINDNLRVGAVSLIVGALLHGLLLG